jgi:hypothetical protein
LLLFTNLPHFCDTFFAEKLFFFVEKSNLFERKKLKVGPKCD